MSDSFAQTVTVARALDTVADELGQLLDLVAALHRPATWDGEAATRSRARFAAHDDRRRHVAAELRRLADSVEQLAMAEGPGRELRGPG